MIFQIIAIVILFVFYACYFGKMISQKKKDLIFICSVHTMRNSWRAGVSKTDKTELVTSGIYQISRNPAFVGFDLVYLGILLMFFNWTLLVVSIFAAFMLHLQIIYVEEDFLITVFGKDYLNYSKKVKRYIGRKKGANS